jgi:hypothetical protein
MSAARLARTPIDPNHSERESPALGGAFRWKEVLCDQWITTGMRWRAPLALVISTT